MTHYTRPIWILDYVIWSLGAGLIVLAIIMSACSTPQPPSAESIAQSQAWHTGPGNLMWIDAGDDIRCFRYNGDFSCVRVQP